MECKGDGGDKATRRIQKKGLQLLQQVGPTNYNLLFLQFELHNGYVRGAIDELLHGKLIELDARKMGCLTEAGYRLLDDLKYWSEV